MTTKNRVEDNRLNYCKNCGEILQENQDFCPNCGVHAGNGNRYCDNCGAEVAADAAFCPNCGTALKSNQTYGKPVTGTLVSEEAAAKVQPRSLVTAIILSLVTCGIYGIFWWTGIADRTKRFGRQLNQHIPNEPSSVMGWLIGGFFLAFPTLVGMYKVIENVNEAAKIFNSLPDRIVNE